MDPGNPLWDLKQAELRSVGHVPVVPLTSCGVLGQPATCTIWFLEEVELRILSASQRE